MDVAAVLPVALIWPFAGLALAWQILFGVCFAIVVVMFLWSLLLFVRGHAAIVHPPPAPEEGADAFTWVFLVPALNEEVTIADSVARLLELPVARRRIVVIDDASTDRTPEILAAIEHPDLFVLRREKPDAQKGKAAGAQLRLPRPARHRGPRAGDRRHRRRRRPPARRRAALRRQPLRRTLRSAASSRWSGSTTARTR